MPDGFGWMGPDDPASELNQHTFLVWSILAGISTAKLVQVVAVNGNDDGPVGFVDVKVILSMVDGAGNAVPPGTVQNAPYFRLQGGTCAVIVEPQVGDVGIMICADRDISSAKKNRGPANPGSAAIMSLSDGLYIGGVLNGKPEQYVRISPQEVFMTPDKGETFIKMEPGSIRIQADTIQIHALIESAWDVFGTGFVYQKDLIQTYDQGVPVINNPPTPPEVPL